MPLFEKQDTPIAPIPPGASQDIIIDTSSIYTNSQFNSKIIPYLDGSPWVTYAYYGQYLGRDDVITNSSDITDPTLKQYLKIQKFELRVTSPLTQTYSETTGTTSVIGTANVYPIISPIVGDVFIAEIEFGSQGIFEITNVERASLFRESAWIVTYAMINYATADVVAELDSYVVNNAVFDVSLLGTGSNPLRTLSENTRAIDKDALTLTLISEYYDEFYNTKLHTLLVPDPNIIIYDPHVVKFWNKIVSSDHPMPIEYDIGGSLLLNDYITLFDCLIKQNPAMITRAVKSMNSISVGAFAATYIRNTIANLSIGNIIYPYIDDQKPLRNSNDPIITDTYILTDTFYNKIEPLTALESLVTNAINRTVLAYKDITTFTNVRDTLTPIERFYQLPIYILLLQLAR